MPPEPHPDTSTRANASTDADPLQPNSSGQEGPTTKPLGPGLFDDDLLDDGDPSRSRPGLKWIVASGLVILLGAGGWLGYRTWQRRSVDPVVVTTGTPSRDTLENRVDASGIMSLGNQQILKAPGDVTVEAVLVEERQRVEPGAVLLRLRDRNLEQELDDAQIQTEILRLQRQRNAEVLQDRQRTVQRAEERLRESRSLVDQGFISEDEYNGDRDELEAAQSELRGAEVDLQRAELEIRQNQASLANIRARIADNAIVAPFDAVVLNIDVQPGDGVQSEGTLLTIGDPTQEVVLFDLMTLDANKVSVNMPVRVSVIGPNPENYTGRVISIAPQAITDTEGGGGGSQAMVQAVAQLDRPSGVLIPGGSVSVEVILVQRENALALPSNAIQQEGGETFVWVVDAEGRAQKRPVTTGLDTLEAVEIVSGLDDTDTVILTPPPDQPLEAGLTVEATPATPGGRNRPTP
ncbi:efflux RND transporter periplasmic adaptor subunit [Leptolyngbya sp. CCNP1308]|uniref:efflux RND transporter periplasmic adaptor subunit n=1 Tax=Leptolyngbya sp. CCNP1308 TaxID=3110255 RepID=UPI002B2152CB|nr:efflux RND transporter periplasmic adaptor subunit [Leptolyngbya sp. CCNP1308]MEA5448633.1 efflux RND transporter periplasmic adaptor subunit [Leptolyngbya sp. CCNP1308]